MELVTFNETQIDLIKRTLLDTEKVSFSKDELALFINQCQRTGLDPFTRQIYATKNQGKVSIQATIDGLRLIAERSTKYAGQTRATFFDHDGNEFKVWPNSKGLPYACEVGVLRHDFKEPVYAVAIFDEYCQRIKDFKTGETKLGFMWAKMPSLMLQKVAEALALRKAFPNDLSGIYSREEMEQSESQVFEVNENKTLITSGSGGAGNDVLFIKTKEVTDNGGSSPVIAPVVAPPIEEAKQKPRAVTKPIDAVAPSTPPEVPTTSRPRNLALAAYKISGGPLYKYPNLGKVPESEARKWIDSVTRWSEKPDVTIPPEVKEAVENIKAYWGWE